MQKRSTANLYLYSIIYIYICKILGTHSGVDLQVRPLTERFHPSRYIHVTYMYTVWLANFPSMDRCPFRFWHYLVHRTGSFSRWEAERIDRMEAQRTVYVSAGAGVDLEKLHEKSGRGCSKSSVWNLRQRIKRPSGLDRWRRGRKNGTRLQRHLGLAKAKNAQNNWRRVRASAVCAQAICGTKSCRVVRVVGESVLCGTATRGDETHSHSCSQESLSAAATHLLCGVAAGGC